MRTGKKQNDRYDPPTLPSQAQGTTLKGLNWQPLAAADRVVTCIGTAAARGRVGPRGTGANLRICRKKSQIRGAVATAVARTSGRSDRPASDLEMDTLEVTGYIAFLNMVALKNKPDHQVDADGEHR